MAESYCGKSCEACSFKERLNCSGCMAGPGRVFGGDCELAKCCQERGHTTCATCNQNNWCSKQRNAVTQAETRYEKLERERVKREQLEKHVHKLAKYLTIIFWLTIVSFVPSLMGNDLTKALPMLHKTGQMISLVFSLAIAAIYFLMGKINSRYRKAAVCMGVDVVASFVQNLATGGETPPWTLLISIPMVVLGLVCRYNLYSANSEVLVSADYTMSEKWMQLWKWYIRLSIALVVSIVIVLILPIIGLLLLLVAVIGMGVVSIVELVYTYRLMDCFRAYAANLTP